MKTLILQRQCERNTSPRILNKQLTFICEESIGKVKHRWEYQLKLLESQTQLIPYKWLYKLTFNPTNSTNEGLEWVPIYNSVSKLSSLSGRFGRYPWKILEGDIPRLISVEHETKDYASFALERNNYFDHLYGLDAQIDIIYNVICELKNSELTNRFHCVCFGDPGVGKTDVLLSFGKMLGRENESYFVLDATSMTEAGVIQLLMNTQIIPPVLIIEEIEKAPENTMRFLLGLMDHRAQIRKTNFRIGHQCEHVRMLVLATVNDKEKFDKALSGAICSRFSYDIYFPKQNREILEKILMREVNKIDGNHEWVEATLKFCVDDSDLDRYFKRDPRKIIPICICGKDRLLDLSFQEQFMKILPPHVLEDIQESSDLAGVEQISESLAEEFGEVLG